MAWFGGDTSEPKPDTSDPVPQDSSDATPTGNASCSRCKEPGAELRCARCGAPYCSPECQRADWKLHKLDCPRLAQKASAERAAPGVSSNSVRQSGAKAVRVPDLSDEIGGPKLKDWNSLTIDRGIADKERLQSVKNRECFSLAFLQALQALPSLKKHLPSNFRLEPVGGRCVLWVLGARDGIEKRQMVFGCWETGFGAIDVGWDVALIGPEMEPDKHVHEKLGCRVYTFNCTSHEAELPEHLKRPTLICGFNTGMGSSATPRMMSWLPTLEQVLLMRRPVLFTCFGDHEAVVEAAILRAARAQFTPHRHGGFGFVLEDDKPLSVCNEVFTFVCGSSASDDILTQHLMPHIISQLRSVELLTYLSDVHAHVTILGDPDGSGHRGWMQTMNQGGGAVTDTLKKSLAKDEDGQGGISTIVRCSVDHLKSACENHVCAAVLLELGGADLLEKFSKWTQTAHWTPHKWMMDDVAKGLEEMRKQLADPKALELVKDLSNASEELEEPVECIFRIGSSAVPIRAHPDLAAAKLASASSGQNLCGKGHKGLWLKVAHEKTVGWVLCFDGGSISGRVMEWNIVEPP